MGLAIRGRVFQALILLFLALLVAEFSVVLGLNSTEFGHVSDSKLERIKRLLDKINKPAVLTIESSDGDIIDCVDINKQPAFDHPLLKHHKIQMVPPQRPREDKVKKNKVEHERMNIAHQLWHRNGTSCPKGTIPIRRTTVPDLLRFKSFSNFGKKQPYSSSLSKLSDPENLTGPIKHEYAVAYVSNDKGIYGVNTRINVWKPIIHDSFEFSLSQIWIIAGSYGEKDLNSIEAGWQIYPAIYNNSDLPRFFIFWTANAYQGTGCYNLGCPGFVQTNPNITLGSAIDPISEYGGDQYEIKIVIWKDRTKGHWWLEYDDTVVGYWPNELFTTLREHAKEVHWGGEITNSFFYGRHTSTQMGSGNFAEEGYERASFFRLLQIAGSDYQLEPVKNLITRYDNLNCYNITTFKSDEWGTSFYYGGPGYNPNCP